jgi:hypothetical protein
LIEHFKINENAVEDTEKEILKSDFDKLKEECKKVHNENKDLVSSRTSILIK